MLSQPSPKLRYVLPFALLLLLCLVSLLLNRIGRFFLGALLFLLGLTFAIMAVVLQSFLIDQVSSPEVFYCCFTVLAAGMLLGPRSTFVFATLNAVIIITIGFVASGVLPVDEAWGDLVPAAVLSYLMALVAWLYGSSLEKALLQLTERSQQLEAANKEIHAFSRTLEAKVEERTRELRTFVSMVAHDLRSPLAVVHGYAEILQDRHVDTMDERQKRAVSTIAANVQHILHLMDDLLEISTLQAGQTQFDMEAVSIEGVIYEVCDGFKHQISHKQLGLKMDLPGELPRVWGDRFRLTQVLNNLMGNAYDYTPSGAIIVGAQPVDDFVQVSVSDTGVGIPLEEQEHLFTHFFRGEHDVVRSRKGAGLGLAIARSIVETHDGEIWVESEPGKGATFHFTVPVVTSQV
jgi:signal transduction histidine kinase